MSTNSIFGWIEEYRKNHNTADVDISSTVNGICVIVKHHYRGWQYICEKYCFDPRDNTYIDIRYGLWKKNNCHWKECSHDDWTFIFKEAKQQMEIGQEKVEHLQKYVSGEKPAIAPIPYIESRISEIKDEISNISWLV